jgi:methionine-rich copper-binding protein CopC
VRAVASWLLACLTFTAVATVAFAHAHYDHSTPAIGQVLATAPARIEIYTDSEMRKTAGGNVIMVTAADGSRVDDGDTVVDDANRQHFSVGLQPNLSNGRYVVSFKTLSDVDGDTDSGHFAFYVGAGPTAEQKQQDAALSGAPIPTPAPSAAQSGDAPAKPPVIAILAVIAALLVICGGWLLLRRPVRSA